MNLRNTCFFEAAENNVRLFQKNSIIEQHHVFCLITWKSWIGEEKAMKAGDDGVKISQVNVLTLNLCEMSNAVN
jgi:hypothetical protein